MFNYKESNVIERNSFVDEFEVNNEVNTQVNTLPNANVTEEAREFNSRIADNFDRIINYDAYTRTDGVKETQQTVNSFVNGYNYDANPSSTTMQFENMPRAEIYQDFRVETDYQTTTKVRTSAKVAVVILSLVIILLSALVVLNTSLLKNMNNTIDGKLSELQSLEQEYTSLQEELNDVSNDQTIIDKAQNDYGMIVKEG
ncbi:MAG: hypothetical protein E7358_07350 [Clostridiales bacterium]|nr:hypothetical protein [Clostridiales bacterium]